MGRKKNRNAGSVKSKDFSSNRRFQQPWLINIRPWVQRLSGNRAPAKYLTLTERRGQGGSWSKCGVRVGKSMYNAARGRRRHLTESLRRDAERIVETLRAAGHEAYFAGGCVRDMVMGVEPYDYDIATSARPDEVVRLFQEA